MSLFNFEDIGKISLFYWAGSYNCYKTGLNSNRSKWGLISREETTLSKKVEAHIGRQISLRKKATEHSQKIVDFLKDKGFEFEDA